MKRALTLLSRAVSRQGASMGDLRDELGERPLFIIGCVRSGTTLVRNLLRRQPNVICPEETHYFRPGDPFRSPGFHRLMKSHVLKRHRQIDGISEADFNRMLQEATSKGHLMRLHVEHMARARGLDRFRWFDKTPQNIYGIHLIRAEFPTARFLHIVRNPFNVVASLKLGKVVKVEDIQGACNYWAEAVTIIDQFAPLLGKDLLELRYEDITDDPVGTMQSLLEFSELGDVTEIYAPKDTYRERNQHENVLDQADREEVVRRCGAFAERYGYQLRSPS